MEKNINILDCTLRDGGYYNNWDFKFKDIQKYINSVASTEIRYVELGFRFLEKNKIRGLTAYTEDKLINNLKIPSNVNIGVMINVGDLLKNKRSTLINCKKLFRNKNNKLKFVRLACHYEEIFLIKDVISWLKKNNFIVFVNLMQISEIENNKIIKVCSFLKSTKVDIFYFADSLGSLTPKKTKNITQIIKKNFNRQIGIHAHDNLGYALQNSLKAYENGANWIDSTITGMGRGPGNLRTEVILRYYNIFRFLNKKNINKSTLNFFLSLKKKYNWGKNKFYAFAARNKIHPTYIQQILSDERYLKNDYNKILSALSKLDTKKYNPNKLVNSAIFLSNSTSGTWAPKSVLKKRDVLILGPGKNLKSIKKKIEEKILKKNLFVICLNNFSYLNDKYINLRAICHPLRIASDKVKLKKLKTKIAIPISSMSQKIRKSIDFKKGDIYDYGLTIGPTSKITVKNKYCVLPSPLAIGYVLSMVISGKARSVKVAGLDGYEKSDPDYDNTDELLKIFVKKYFKSKLVSLTKTKFNFLSYKKNNA